MTRITRNDNTRLSSMRPQYNMDYRSRFHIPDEFKSDDKQISFVNTEIQGQPTYKVEDASYRGYEILEVGPSATTYNPDPLNRRGALAQRTLVNKDTIAMIREKTFEEREKEHYQNNTNRSVNSLKGVTSTRLNINSF